MVIKHDDHLPAQGWQAALQGGPDYIVINSVVAVNKMIPHTYDPTDFWNALTDVWIKRLGLTQCLTDDPELPLDRSTDEFVLEVII